MLLLFSCSRVAHSASAGSLDQKSQFLKCTSCTVLLQQLKKVIPFCQHLRAARPVPIGTGTAGQPCSALPLPHFYLAAPLLLLQLLGLEDVQMPLGPVIEAAYEELLNLPLEDGYRSGAPAPFLCLRIPDKFGGSQVLHMPLVEASRS